MGLILDTSVLIAAERKNKLNFLSQWEEYESAYISSISVTELLIGVYRADSEERRIKRSAFVEHIISSIASLPFGEEEARIYAQILNNLYKAGITLGVHDMLIGATAISHGYGVLTLNEQDFNRISGLKVIGIKLENTKH
jgi:predicted nucleic acid-binding protein